MTRTAWIILGCVVFALAVYAFRPAPAAQGPAPFVAGTATRFTLEAGGHRQEVEGERVRLDGLERRLDAGRAQGLWAALSQITPEPARIVAGVRAEQLASYGLTAPARLDGAGSAGTIDVRWGRSGPQAYVWDGVTQRLAAVDPAVIARLDAAAGRLDERQAVAVPLDTARLTCDGAVWALGPGGWVVEGHPERPRGDQRVRRLLALLQGLLLDDLSATAPPAAREVARLEVPSAAIPRRVSLLDDGDRLWVRVDGLPPQVQTPAQATAWRDAIAALHGDMLVDASTMVARDRIESIRVQNEGQPTLELVRGDELAGHRSGHRWEVVWSGGREPAAPDAMTRLMEVLDTLALRDPVVDPVGTALATGVVITIVAGNERVVVAQSRDGILRSQQHRGVALDAERLRAAVRPSALLDRRLAVRNPQRIVKIQRRQPHLGQAEVLTRREQGLWLRTWPAPTQAADGPAVDHLVRVVAASSAVAVDVATDAAGRAQAQAILAAPEAELAIRYAPAELGQAANDETDLDETASQDWGLALVRAPGGWLGTDADGALLYHLDDDTVQALLAPAEGGRLFPILPAMVQAIEGQPERGAHWRIERDGAGWKAVGDDHGAVADVAVRRLLRALTEVMGRPDARRAEPATGAPSVVVEVTALGGGKERLRLAQAGAGELWVGSDKAESGFPRGAAPATIAIPTLADLR